MQPDQAISGQVTKSLSEIIKRILKKVTIISVVGVVVEIVSLYIVMSPPLWASVGLVDRLIFHPDKTHYDVRTIRSQIEAYFHTKIDDVTFESANGKKLHAYFLKYPGAKK